jgi:hypothetical protein
MFIFITVVVFVTVVVAGLGDLVTVDVVVLVIESGLSALVRLVVVLRTVVVVVVVEAFEVSGTLGLAAAGTVVEGFEIGALKKSKQKVNN